MKKIVALLLTALLALSLCAVSLADDVWTSGKTVFIDVPARAGGGTDLIIRYITQALTELNPGVNFVVNNYDVSEVGLAHAAYADRDGLTLTVQTSGGVTNYYTGVSGFNPAESYAIVAQITSGGPQAYVATPNLPFNNMNELVEYIRTSDKKLNIGVSLGAISHFAWLNTFNAIDPELNNMVNYVQSGGEADKLTNIASGSINLANCSMNSAISYQEAGNLKVIGCVGPDVANLETISELVGSTLGEEFKTMPEQGIPYALNAGNYLVVPFGTDPAIIEAINAKLMELNGNETFENGMKTMGQFAGVLNVADSQAAYDKEAAEALDMVNNMGMNVISK